MPRALLIGWDGADWRILDPLLERGDLPNLQALIDGGQKAVLRSTGRPTRGRHGRRS
jgi:predicted AlkP superfamily phosphohydrolase/phosphomutase